MFLYRSCIFIIIVQRINWSYIIHKDEHDIVHQILNPDCDKITDNDIDIHHISCKYIGHEITKNGIK